MLLPAAEEVFSKGLTAWHDGRRKEAMAMFEAALKLERKLGSGRPQARYLSYYGLSLGLEQNDLREGLRFGREAVTLEGHNPDIRCNLGELLMHAGRKREAYLNFTQGLSLERDHRGIRHALHRLGVRQRLPLPFLPRDHPINRMLGRLRGRFAA